MTGETAEEAPSGMRTAADAATGRPSERGATPAKAAAANILNAVGRREDLLLRLIAVAITPALVMVFFHKYLPDYAFQITDVPRILTGYDVFWEEMQRVGTFRPRFLSYHLNYYAAKGIEAVLGVPADNRLHPLRIASALITSVSLWITAAPVLLDRTGRWNWRVFYSGLLAMAAVSLYLYLPFDFPALALISLGLVALLHKQRVLAMVLLLVCGLFRENNIHIAWFAVSMLVIPSLSVGLGWTAAYVVAFFAEYWILRKVVFTYEDNNILGVIRANLVSPGAWMMVAIIVGMASVGFVVTAKRMARARRWDPLDVFFVIQFLMVPVWLVFYLVNGSNWTEYRIHLPTLLPMLYALAYRPPASGDSADGVAGGVPAAGAA